MILIISESSDEDLDDIAIGPGASDSEVRKCALYVVVGWGTGGWDIHKQIFDCLVCY